VRVAPAQPFQHHRRVLLFLVAVVCKDRAQLLVARRVHALIVPVHSLEFFHEGGDGAVTVARLGSQYPNVLVELRAVGHLVRSREENVPGRAFFMPASFASCGARV